MGEVKELEMHQPDITRHPGLMKGHIPFMGELLLGHLRYGTQGRNNAEFCHPFIKRDTIPARNLALAGNFNLVNTETSIISLEFKWIDYLGKISYSMYMLHVLMIASLLMLVWQLHLGVLALAGVCAVTLLLVYEHGLVKANDLSRVNAAFFTMNGWVSVLFFVFWAADVILHRQHI